ncbi:MAG: L-histidine N(alpha)-methyltransferase [Chitinophagaceae bacterium]|nr:MAG: L-histidine N(alpha)-methyltransferase [Chitinophagaceae bacterium]
MVAGFHKEKTSAARSFRQDVINGLKSVPKRLQSKYFYDDAGDRLFQDIMAMPEYYLTDAELEIFRDKTALLSQGICFEDTAFDLIELGAGDGVKSRHLLQHLSDTGADFRYMPVDISGNILDILRENIEEAVPGLEMMCLQGEYFEMLEQACAASGRQKVVMILGGNIGNMEKKDSYEFCLKIRQILSPGDRVIIGFDLKKDPFIILGAYNDPSGITAAFNLNLLTRINRELDAGIDVAGFQHYQTYDPLSGACRSFLVSTRAQDIEIDGETISFEKGESIYMEISQKFSRSDIAILALKSGFVPVSEVMDSEQYFVDVIWQVA